MTTLTRRRGLSVIGAFLVAIAVFASALVLGGRFEARAESDSPLLEAPTTSTSARSVTDPLEHRDFSVTTVAPLPEPEDPPDDPYADVPIVPVGTIVIPKIGVDHTVYEGIWLTVIDKGPGHWPGSAMPGERGNSVFPGHRVTNTRPFYDLDQLVPGDEVTFRTDDGEFTYAVTGTQIVVPTDMWVVDPTENPTMTLIACHPKGSARQRIVVKGDLVRSSPAPSAGG